MPGKKIFLGLMPFWAPLSPPLGLSLLKSHLKARGFDVVIHDFNTNDELWEILNRYFGILAEVVPLEKRTNFYMVGFDILGNHLTAYIHKGRESPYYELLEYLIRENYSIEVETGTITALDQVISNFYQVLSGVLANVFRETGPDLFGLSVNSPSLGPSLFAFKWAKEKYPGVKTVMGGGVFADHLSPDSPNFPVFLEKTVLYIDNIIVGEGELLFERYLCGDLSTGQRVYSLSDIQGENLDLSHAPHPDFSGLDLAAYAQMAIYATRSCPFQCSFCSETVQWGKFRKKNAVQVVDELTLIKKQYGGKLFMFGDSLLNMVINELSQNLLKKGPGIYWDGYLRTDRETGNPGNAALWKKAGFYRARLGVETGSQHILDLMNKKMTVAQIKQSISNLAGAGIKTTTYWVIGHPGETEADFQETLELLSQLKNDIYEADWHPFYFFPRGQVNSGKWLRENKIKLLYPDKFSDLLLTQTWVLETSPTRTEIVERMNRFGEMRRKSDIPNPYSIMDIYRADKRWQSLHANAGPTILEIHNCKHLK